MKVQGILAKHFQPAGVLGDASSRLLERDLRQHARLNAMIYGALLILLVAILAGVAFLILADTREGRSLRTTVLAGAGVTLPLLLELIRRTVREWSQASLLLRLARGLEGAQLQSVIEKLIDANR